MEVAPQLFGGHGGDLIGADEITGDVIFIRYDGTSGVLIRPELPAGAGIGVGSVGFTAARVHRPGRHRLRGDRLAGPTRAPTPSGGSPPRSSARCASTRTTSSSPPRPGGRRSVVRCRATCRTFPFGDAAGAKIQGHVTVVLGPAPPEIPRAGSVGVAVLAVVTAVLVGGGFILFLVHNRRKVRFPEPADR